MVLGQQLKTTHDRRAETAFVPVPAQFSQVRVEDAGTAAFRQAIQESSGHHFVDAVAAITTAHAAPVWVAPEEFERSGTVP